MGTGLGSIPQDVAEGECARYVCALIVLNARRRLVQIMTRPGLFVTSPVVKARYCR